jgi:hypothetical protein
LINLINFVVTFTLLGLITDFDRYWLLEFSLFFFNYARVGLMVMQNATDEKQHTINWLLKHAIRYLGRPTKPEWGLNSGVLSSGGCYQQQTVY